MIVLECLVLSITLCQVVDRDTIGRLDPLDRNGTHHAIITGRVLLDDGSPAREVAVQAICRENDRTCLAAEARANAFGRFRLEDVSVPRGLALSIFDAERHQALTL